MARNTSEKTAVDNLPCWIILRAENYQTEEDAAVVVPWSYAEQRRIKGWALRFRAWREEHQDLQQIEATGVLCAYDSWDVRQWVDDRPVTQGDFYDEAIYVYDNAPPVDDWHELRVRAPRMIIGPNMVYWEFITAHGDGHFETEPLQFDDKKVFGPDAT